MRTVERTLLNYLNESKKYKTIEFKKIFASELAKIEYTFYSKLNYRITKKEDILDYQVLKNLYPYVSNLYSESEILVLVEALGKLRLKCSHYNSYFDRDSIKLSDELVDRMPYYLDYYVTSDEELTCYGAYLLISMFLPTYDFHYFTTKMFNHFSLDYELQKNDQQKSILMKNGIVGIHKSLNIVNKSIKIGKTLINRRKHFYSGCVESNGIDFFLEFEKIMHTVYNGSKYCSFCDLLRKETLFDDIRIELAVLRNFIFHGSQLDEEYENFGNVYTFNEKFIFSCLRDLFKVCSRTYISEYYIDCVKLIKKWVSAIIMFKYGSSVETSLKLLSDEYYKDEKCMERISRITNLFNSNIHPEDIYDAECEEILAEIISEYKICINKNKFENVRKNDYIFEGNIKYKVFKGESIIFRNKELSDEVVIFDLPECNFDLFSKKDGSKFNLINTINYGLNTIEYYA